MNDINDPGQPGTLQHAHFLIARALTTEDWEEISRILERLIQAESVEWSLELNSLACTVEEICRCRNLARKMLHRRELQ